MPREGEERQLHCPTCERETTCSWTVESFDWIGNTSGFWQCEECLEYVMDDSDRGEDAP